MPAQNVVHQLPLRGDLPLTTHCKTWQCFPLMCCLDRLRCLESALCICNAQQQSLHMPGGVSYRVTSLFCCVLKTFLAALPQHGRATAKAQRLGAL